MGLVAFPMAKTPGLLVRLNLFSIKNRSKQYPKTSGRPRNSEARCSSVRYSILEKISRFAQNTPKRAILGVSQRTAGARMPASPSCCSSRLTPGSVEPPFRSLWLDPQRQRHWTIRRGGRDLAAEAQR
jgi:hypothetical protein